MSCLYEQVIKLKISLSYLYVVHYQAQQPQCFNLIYNPTRTIAGSYNSRVVICRTKGGLMVNSLDLNAAKVTLRLSHDLCRVLL